MRFALAFVLLGGAAVALADEPLPLVQLKGEEPLPLIVVKEAEPQIEVPVLTLRDYSPLFDVQESLPAPAMKVAELDTTPAPMTAPSVILSRAGGEGPRHRAREPKTSESSTVVAARDVTATHAVIAAVPLVKPRPRAVAYTMPPLFTPAEQRGVVMLLLGMIVVIVLTPKPAAHQATGSR